MTCPKLTARISELHLKLGWLTPPFRHRAHIKLSQALGTQMLLVGNTGPPGIHYITCHVAQKLLWGMALRPPPYLPTLDTEHSCTDSK